MGRFRLTGVIWREEGDYVSLCPEFNVASCGDDPCQAMENLKEAVELYLDNARELGIIEELSLFQQPLEKYTSSFEVAAR